MFKYKQIIPAENWFHIAYHKEQDSITVLYIAAWGLCEDSGEVVGLLSIPGETENARNHAARLYSVPPCKSGFYKHKNELNALEKKALEMGGSLKHVSEHKASAVI